MMEVILILECMGLILAVLILSAQ